jgi:hypothetical protein
MMSTKNDITGDSITSKKNTDLYRDNWERIFGKNQKNEGRESEALKNKAIENHTLDDSLNKIKEQP